VADLPFSQKTTSTAQNDQLGRLLWETCTAQVFSSSRPKDFLRVECHPRADVEHICRALQVSCAAHDNDNDNDNDGIERPLATDNPFEGPVPMTVSQSKCMHRLTVVTVRAEQ
jgi:hypothetical protein